MNWDVTGSEYSSLPEVQEILTELVVIIMDGESWGVKDARPSSRSNFFYFHAVLDGKNLAKYLVFAHNSGVGAPTLRNPTSPTVLVQIYILVVCEQIFKVVWKTRLNF